jgi:hypothetical protein
MKALSIKQPWAWLIVNGYKDIENRDWATTFRGPVLIHAGKKPDDIALQYNGQKEEFYPLTDSMQKFLRDRQLGDILHQMYHAHYPENTFNFGGIVGVATITGCVGRSDSPWFVGEYGFVLKDARPLPFVPLRGQLGFFDVPDEIVAQLSLPALI